MKMVSILQMIVRITGTIQLILGIVFWSGNAEFLIPVHILLGSILTIALWVLAYQASRAGVSRGMVILAALWGVGLPVWGLAQEEILPGSSHWITEVLHLLCGIGAVGLAEMLGAQMKKKGTGF